MPLRVIYFTVVPLATATNGGNIACRNNIVRLGQDDNIQLHVIAAPLHHDIALTRAFLDTIHGDYRIVPRLPTIFHQETMTFQGAMKFALQAAAYFPWELEALNQPQFDQALLDTAKAWTADVIVIDYVFSALFCPRVMSGPTKTVIITQNREAQFHRDMIGLGLIKHDRITAELSALRLSGFEKRTYQGASLVVGLTDNDLPFYIPAKKKTSISPYLDPREPWSYSKTGSVFFVGNIGHFPNREAVEFIATKLAPKMESRAPDLRFKIVGAASEDVPSSWHHRRVDYLGISDAETVRQFFTTSDAMLCPISNTYGVKFKMLEAVAHGTPIISSTEAFECLPYIKGLPTFPFSDADSAADILARLINEPSALERMSASISADARAFQASQKSRWSDVLSRI